MKLLAATALNPLALRQADVLEKMVFKYAYDKTVSFGLNFHSSEMPEFMGEPNLAMFTILDKLAKRELTGDQARQLVIDFAQTYGSLIMLICNKHLNAGISATTINKYIPQCVPVFMVQLAKEVPLEKVKFPCYGQLKYDGVRVVITKTNEGQILFNTRNGLELHLPETAKRLQSLPNDTVLDTEVTIRQGTSVDRTKVSGMLNSARQGGSINEHCLVFNAFDYLTATEFKAQKCTHRYQVRLSKLKDFVDSVLTPDQQRIISVAETLILSSATEANTWFENVLKQGQEGLILKPMDHLYTYKRSKDWIKLKAIKTVDLMCIGVEEGDGKYTGQVGALVCEGYAENIFVKVKVGSGLTDVDRELAPADYVGKTIEIKYNALIRNTISQEYSLFLPRFVEVRHDK